MFDKPPTYSSEFLKPHPWLDSFCSFLRENWDTPSIPISEIIEKTGLKQSELPWGYACPFWYRFEKNQTYSLVWKNNETSVQKSIS